MEETFLLSSSDSHVTSKHGVQSRTVSDEGWTNRQRLQRTAATFNFTTKTKRVGPKYSGTWTPTVGSEAAVAG